MTYEEAKALISFNNYCNCGGYAYSMNGRDPANPHMTWCPQKQEYDEWYKALHSKPEASDSLK